MTKNQKKVPEIPSQDDGILGDISGSNHWRKSKIQTLTGFGTIHDSVNSVVNNGAEAKERLKQAATAAFKDRDTRGRAVDPSIVDHKERFEEAVRINFKTESHINIAINNTFKQFWMYLGLLIISLLWGAYSVSTRPPTISGFILLDIIFALIPFPVLSALTIRAAYTNWFMRNRTLAPFSEYLKSKDILPQQKNTRRPMNKKNGSKIIKSLAIALALMVPISMMMDVTPAIAQQYQPPTGEEAANIVFSSPGSDSTDIFIQLLSYIAPGVGPIPDINDNSYAAAGKVAFSVFSGILLFLATLFIGFQILSSMVATAKEGVALGRQYHEVWAPIRAAIGAGMLVPVAGGLCAAQVIVMFFIVWGGNLANMVWTPYVNVITQTGTTSDGDDIATQIVTANLGTANNMVRNLVEKELCAEAARQFVNNSGYGYYRNNAPAVVRFENSDNFLNATRWNKDDVEYTANYGSLCGKIQTYVQNEPAEGDNSDSAIEKRVKHIISDTQFKALQIMQLKIQAVTPAIVSTYISTQAQNSQFFGMDRNDDEAQEQLRAAMKEMIQEYNKSIHNAIRVANQLSDPFGGANGELEKVRLAAAQDGWAASGTIYLAITRLQNAIYNQGSRGAEFTHTSVAYRDSYPINKFVYGDENTVGILPAFNIWWDENVSEISPTLTSEAAKSAETNDIWGWMNGQFSFLTNWWKWGETVNVLNPMHRMITLGNNLMIGGGTLLAALSLADSVTEGVKGIPLAGGVVGGMFAGALGTALGLAKMMALAIIAAGAAHAYILPMIPYIMTVFFVGGMLILTVESLIAAPLWAFFHIRMDGENFVSEVQKPGYMIAFNLLLRPSLMIFGLIMSFIVFGAMAWFVERTFFAAAGGLTSSMGVGPIGTIVMIVLVTYIHYQLAVRAFSLINQVPDRVSRWFGQAGERLGEEDDTNKTNALLISTTNRIEGMAKAGGIMRPREPGASSKTQDTPDKPDDPSKATNNAKGAEKAPEKLGSR